MTVKIHKTAIATSGITGPVLPIMGIKNRNIMYSTGVIHRKAGSCDRKLRNMYSFGESVKKTYSEWLSV